MRVDGEHPFFVLRDRLPANRVTGLREVGVVNCTVSRCRQRRSSAWSASPQAPPGCSWGLAWSSRYREYLFSTDRLSQQSPPDDVHKKPHGPRQEREHERHGPVGRGESNRRRLETAQRIPPA